MRNKQEKQEQEKGKAKTDADGAQGRIMLRKLSRDRGKRRKYRTRSSRRKSRSRGGSKDRFSCQVTTRPPVVASDDMDSSPTHSLLASPAFFPSSFYSSSPPSFPTSFPPFLNESSTSHFLPGSLALSLSPCLLTWLLAGCSPAAFHPRLRGVQI